MTAPTRERLSERGLAPLRTIWLVQLFDLLYHYGRVTERKWERDRALARVRDKNG